ncbi:hypothetical protein HY493_01620 [Candidatus Woesearchaeota archaeon]|nr:hypothetical protein [Candidatus Woesearchaeota archaeon]
MGKILATEVRTDDLKFFGQELKQTDLVLTEVKLDTFGGMIASLITNFPSNLISLTGPIEGSDLFHIEISFPADPRVFPEAYSALNDLLSKEFEQVSFYSDPGYFHYCLPTTDHFAFAELLHRKAAAILSRF